MFLSMPWSDARYPPSMRHLEPLVRAKAIEIANALLNDGMDDGRAIRIAIAKAKEWAARHAAGAPSRNAVTDQFGRTYR